MLRAINITKALEKKIEGAYFKEDMRRALIHEIGDVAYPSQVNDRYCTAFEKLLHVDTLRNSRAKVVIDYVYAVSGAVLPQMLDKFGADAVVLNASVNKTAMSITDREGLLTQLGHVVEALKANFGVQVSANGEQLILVDESGFPIRGEMLTALMVDMILTANPRGTVVVPVHASSAVEQVARRHDGRVIRTKANPTALMEAVRKIPTWCWVVVEILVLFSRNCIRALIPCSALPRLIEMLTIQERSLASVRAELPRVIYKTYTVRCPWTAKGALMRYLVETHPAQNLELIDGVKICQPYDDSWLLVLPDASEPLVHLYANSNDRDWVDETLRNYRSRVQTFVERQQEHQPRKFNLVVSCHLSFVICHLSFVICHLSLTTEFSYQSKICLEKFVTEGNPSHNSFSQNLKSKIILLCLT